MKQIRILALLLALALCLTACGSGASSTTSSDSSPAESSAESSQEPSSDTAIPDEALTDVVSYLTGGAFTADSVVATVGDIQITAGQVLYWTAYQQYNMTYYYYSTMGYSISMSDDLGDGTTVGQALLQFGLDTALVYATGYQKALDTGLSLSEENAAAISSLSEDNVTSYGQDRWQAYLDAGLISEEDFTDEEKADWIQTHGAEFYQHSLMYYACTPADYTALTSSYYYYSTLQDSLFGEGGEYAPTDETMNDYLQDYIDDNGICWARCSLFSTQDCADDAAVAEVQAQAQEVYDQLAALPADQLGDAFTEMQSQYDGSDYTAGQVQQYTNSSSLVDGYYDGIQALEPGQLGMTDQTTYGYFILLREPDQTDTIYDAVLSDYINTTYSALIDQWQQDYGVSDDSAILELDTDAFYSKLDELRLTLATVNTITAADEVGVTGTDDTADTGDTPDAGDTSDTGDTASD